MIATDQSGLVHVGVRSLRNKLLGWFALAWIALHIAVNVFINKRYGHDGFLLEIGVVLGSVFLTVALVAIATTLNRAGNARAAKRLERWPDDRAVTPIAATGEGKVAVRGRVRAGSVVFEAHGMPTVAATSIRHDGPHAPSLISRVAEFTVEDETGSRAIVRASEAIIVGGVEVDGERIVPDGASVEIAALGAHRLSDAREGGYRSDVRTLELSGTPSEPIVIRVLDDATEPATEAPIASGVRVDVANRVAEIVEEEGTGSSAESKTAAR